jgi:hypothetical protein
LRCLAEHGSIGGAFDKLGAHRRQELLTVQNFHSIFKELDLFAGEESDIRSIYDLVERSSGGLVINEFIVTLNAADPGMNVWLTEEQREVKVLRMVKQHMAPFESTCDEHRHMLRQKVSRPLNCSIPTGTTAEPQSYYCSSLAWQNIWGRKHESRPPSKLKKASSAPVLPAITSLSLPLARSTSPDSGQRRRSVLPPAWSQRDQSKTMSLLRSASPDPYHQEGDLDFRDDVEEYFDSANNALASDRQWLEQSFTSPVKQFRNMQAAARLAGK